jgi:hypothetical protein
MYHVYSSNVRSLIATAEQLSTVTDVIITAVALMVAA